MKVSMDNFFNSDHVIYTLFARLDAFVPLVLFCLTFIVADLVTQRLFRNFKRMNSIEPLLSHRVVPESEINYPFHFLLEAAARRDTLHCKIHAMAPSRISMLPTATPER